MWSPRVIHTTLPQLDVDLTGTHSALGAAGRRVWVTRGVVTQYPTHYLPHAGRIIGVFLRRMAAHQVMATDRPITCNACGADH